MFVFFYLIQLSMSRIPVRMIRTKTVTRDSDAILRLYKSVHVVGILHPGIEFIPETGLGKVEKVLRRVTYTIWGF